MKVLVLNAGSSSLKASLYELASPGGPGAPVAGDPPPSPRWETDAELPAGLQDAGAADAALARVLAPLASDAAPLVAGHDGIDTIDVVGHRVVDGGLAFRASVRMSAAVRAAIARAAEDAPAHNGPALALIDAATRHFGDRVPQVAAFDTAFHQTLPPVAYAYAGPHAWIDRGYRRLGFHGINHQHVAERAARLLADGGRAPGDALRLVSCHLGSGCSLAAVRDGVSIDTTMGFTPLDGVPMARRSGAVDPGLLLHLLRHGETVDELERTLTRESGLAGLSGTSGDMREVLAAVDRGDARAHLAFDVFVRRVAQGVAAMAVSMGGVDALAFTGGIGEHAPRVRAAVCGALDFLGVALDLGRNVSPDPDACVSLPESRIAVLVVRAAENWMIARDCARVAG